MATKKREIYARAAVQLRTHDRAVRAEQLCPGAMGLYLWMLLQARGEESDGDVLEAAAVASWGAPATFRRKQIEALIVVELVARLGERLHVVKYADHNDDRATITTNRKVSAAKKHNQRHRTIANDHTVSLGDSAGTTPVVPISSSISVSDLESRSREPDLARATVVHSGDPVPDDAREKFESLTMTRPLRTPMADVWAKFCNHFTGEHFPSRERLIGRWDTWVRNQFAFDEKARRGKPDTRQPLTGPEPDWYTRAKSTGTDGTEPF